MLTSLRTCSIEETIAAGQTLGRLLKAGSVVILTGDLGAGKTQFVKGIASGMGVLTTVTSPTFNLMHEYEVDANRQKKSGTRLYHFDLYRLDSPEQLEDLDYFAFLEGDGVSVIEWGDRFISAMPDDYLLVQFAFLGANERQMTMSAVGKDSEYLLGLWQIEIEKGKHNYA